MCGEKTGEKSDEEKLAMLVKHWIEHNTGHADEFEVWSKRAANLGHGKAGEEIESAARLLGRANEKLRGALDALGAS